MATTTITLSQLAPNIKRVHTGVNAVGGAISVATTICPSTRIKMWRVPNGATVIDYTLRIQTGGASQTFQLGTSQTRSCFMSVTTLSQTYSISTQSAAPAPYGAFNQGVFRGWGGTTGVATGVTDLLPTRISLSDDAQPQNIWVIGTVGAGCSASAFLTGIMMYVADGLAGHTTVR